MKEKLKNLAGKIKEAISTTSVLVGDLNGDEKVDHEDAKIAAEWSKKKASAAGNEAVRIGKEAMKFEDNNETRPYIIQRYNNKYSYQTKGDNMKRLSAMFALLLTLLCVSNAFADEISDEYRQSIIDRWTYDIPETVKDIIKVKNYEFGSDLSNTLFKTCDSEYASVCDIKRNPTRYFKNFEYGNITGVYVTVNNKAELVATRGVMRTNEANELVKILEGKYGKPSLVKNVRYSYPRSCRYGPALVGHYYWKDSNGTVIQLDTTFQSSCNYGNDQNDPMHLGRITIMSKPYIDNVKEILIKLVEENEQKKKNH